MRATYTSQFNTTSGLWQILSRSGHVVYESTDGAYVRSICRELCTYFRTEPCPDGAGPVAARDLDPACA